jgi:hypothetical protein
LSREERSRTSPEGLEKDQQGLIDPLDSKTFYEALMVEAVSTDQGSG